MARLRWIGATTGVAAVVAFALGNSEIAWGAIGATPIGMLNYVLMVRAVHGSGGDPKAAPGRILKFSLVRTMLSALALFVAFGFGAYVMLGALIGVTAEMLTYMGDTVRLIRSMRGDK